MPDDKEYEKNVKQLSEAYETATASPDSWTVQEFLDYRIREFGIEIDVLLPNGNIAPDDMTLGELRKLYRDQK